MEKFTAAVREIKLGNGQEDGVTMGPMVLGRSVDAIEAFVQDAIAQGAKACTGGKRVAGKGNFFEPTVLRDVPLSARAMSEEPFGPVALLRPFASYDDAIAEANRLPYGLAAYAYSRSVATVNALGRDVESGMLSINHIGFGLPETPFGGVKDSGHGTEGGSEAIESYLETRFVTVAGR